MFVLKGVFKLVSVQFKKFFIAHSHMQKDWIVNKEEGLKTGILIWDLSAAFNTLDIDLL